MLPGTLQVALKEWAVVQRALLDGHQIVLLRKGGLVEESGDFDLRAREFLLYPTYEHETERKGDIQPCFGQWLQEEERRKPAPSAVRIEAACEVADVIRAQDAESLIRLMPQHIWSEQFVRNRFDWEPYKPVFLLLVRAYRLPNPIELPIRPEYGGCRSWITLSEPVPAAGAAPAIASEEGFRRRIELTASLLQT
ncbi:MAG TPA: DUF1802 family protein [Capsulimonadaceae bacterium]|nr:DUF1802 family protein [Capsulimonadaceae bacterium]